MLLLTLSIVLGVLVLQHLIIPFLLFYGAYHHRVTEENDAGDEFVSIEDSIDPASLNMYSIGQGSRLFIYFHGNSGSLCGDWLCVVNEFYFRLTEMGYTDIRVVAYDYRGYGLSSGKPTVANTRSDALEMTRYLLAQYEPCQLCLYGRSLGAAVAMHVAANIRAPVTLLMLETPFFGTHCVRFLHTLLSCLPETFACNSALNSIISLGIRTVVLLAEKDTVIDNHAAAKFFKTLHIEHFESLGHNDLFTKGKEKWKIIMAEIMADHM